MCCGRMTRYSETVPFESITKRLVFSDGSGKRYFEVRAVDRLLCRCARTVSELHLFERLRLLFERKQITQLIVNIKISRKPMWPWERFGSLGRAGVASPSRARAVLDSRTLAAHKSQLIPLQALENARSTKLLALIYAKQWPRSAPLRGIEITPLTRSR